MKTKILVAALLFSLLAGSSAFASRARVLTLGTADPFSVIPHGTFFYDETNNIFFNPAYVNDFKNWAVIEKSNRPGNTAEGGFCASIFNFNFGVYLNRGDAITTGPGLATYIAGQQLRPIDIYFGSDMGVRWGISATRGSLKTATLETSDTTLRFGFQAADVEPFASFKVKSSEKMGQETKVGGWVLGARYKWGEMIPFAAIRRDSAEPGIRSIVWGVGTGRSSKIGDGVNIHYAISYWRSTVTNHNVIPLNLGIEGEISPWFLARAGLSYHLIDRQGGYTQGDTTQGRLGAAVHFKKVEFEWALGNGVGTESLNDQTFDLAHGFFTAASLAYRW